MFIEESKLQDGFYIEESSRGLPEKTFNKLSKPEQEEYCKKHPESRYAKKALERDSRRVARESEKLSDLQKEVNKDHKSGKNNWVEREGKFTSDQVRDKMQEGICIVEYIKADGTHGTYYGTLKPEEIEAENKASAARKEAKMADPNYKPRKARVMTDEEKKAKALEYVSFIDATIPISTDVKDRGRWRSFKTSNILSCKMVRDDDEGFLKEKERLQEGYGAA